jgi:DNA-binding winged helix-turn-helix (wHTH) protein
MTRISSRIGSNSFRSSGLSALAPWPPRSTSTVQKENGAAISHATAQCAVRTNEHNTAYRTGDAFAMFGCITVDFSGAEAYRDGVKVSLTALEWKVLRYFIDNPGRVLSRNELLNKVWGYNDYPTTRTVDNLILKLRQKLELDTKSPSHFVTVHGIGYKFLREESESGALARLQSSRPSIRRNTDCEGDGADLRNMILGYLSVVYELLTRNSPQGSMPPEGLSSQLFRKDPHLYPRVKNRIDNFDISREDHANDRRNSSRLQR